MSQTPSLPDTERQPSPPEEAAPLTPPEETAPLTPPVPATPTAPTPAVVQAPATPSVTPARSLSTTVRVPATTPAKTVRAAKHADKRAEQDARKAAHQAEKDAKKAQKNAEKEQREAKSAKALAGLQPVAECGDGTTDDGTSDDGTDDQGHGNNGNGNGNNGNNGNGNGNDGNGNQGHGADTDEVDQQGRGQREARAVSWSQHRQVEQLGALRGRLIASILVAGLLPFFAAWWIANAYVADQARTNADVRLSFSARSAAREATALLSETRSRALELARNEKLQRAARRRDRPALAAAARAGRGRVSPGTTAWRYDDPRRLGGSTN